MHVYSKNKLRLGTLSAILVPLFVGCASSSGPQNYVLRRPEWVSTAKQTKIPKKLFLEEFTAAPEYSSLSVAYKSSPDEIYYYSQQRWAVSPEEMIGDRTFQYFRDSDLFTQVINTHGISEADLYLKGHILKVGEKTDDKIRYAELSIHFQLLDKNTQTVIWQATMSKQQEVSSKRFASVIETISVLLQEIIQECLLEVHSNLQPK